MKGTLFAIGNDERSCYFIFRKEQKLLNILIRMFSGMESYQDELLKEMVYKDYEAGESINDDKIKEKDIKSMVDERYVFSGHGNWHIEIIFGHCKVFVNCSGKKKEISRIRKFVSENFEFAKPK